MSYIQWFIKMGWKSYLVPFLLAIIIDIALVIYRNELTDMPIFAIVIALVSIPGFNIGIVYHSIGNWKANMNG